MLEDLQMREKNWDIYEVALLIEAYLKIEEGANKISTLESLSINLRKMAKNAGFEIDDKYRNLNGLQWQLGYMKLAFIGASLDYRKLPKLFLEGVLLYKTNKLEFDKILGEAHGKVLGSDGEMVKGDNKAEFINWYDKYDGKKCSIDLFIDCFEKTSDYAIKHKITRCNFWEVVDVKVFNAIRSKLSGDRIFKFRERTIFALFEKWGKIYSIYLKENGGVKVIPQEKNISTDVQKQDKSIDQEGVCTVSFNKSSDYAFSTPVSIIYFDEMIPVKSWKDVYTVALKRLFEDYPNVFNRNIGKSLIGANRIDLGTKIEKMVAPRPIGGGIYAESNLSATDIIKRIKILLDLCCVDYENLVIEYNRDKQIQEDKKVVVRGSGKNKNALQVECPPQLAMLLDRSFSYGFGLNVPNDMLRLKGLASMFGIELIDDEDLLKKQIITHGVKIDDSVYFFNDDFYVELKEMIERVFNQGNDVIFYDVFIEKNQIWADERHIVESLVLRELINKCYESLFFGKTCVVKSEKLTEAEAVVKEVQRVVAGSVLVYIDDVVNQLPYIPEEKIRFHLSVSRWFVRNEANVYVDVTKLVYTETEKQDILNFISSNCQANGYASIVDIPLGCLIENNDLLTESALYNAIFNLFLYEDYYLNGKIVTKEKNGVDATRLVEDYCKTKEQCTVDELVEYVKNITGDGVRRYALEGAYNSMVRIDEETFVADSLVDFDVNSIDALLDQYIKDEFDSITSISVFTLFPSCGMGWNHYILESFVYRFSKKYRLSYYNLNDKNAGIIVNRKCLLTYEEMLAKEVVRKKVPCEKAAIGAHLCQHGFTAKSKMTLYDVVIEKTKKFKGV